VRLALELPSTNSAAPLYFAKPADFRRWLARNHARGNELWVGFYRKDSGQPSITWPESVDEALCFGWIDGIRKKVNDRSYKVRFTPRRPKSTWSAINIARVGVLTRERRMHPAGIAAFARREEKNSARYSFENREAARLNLADKSALRRDRIAWQFFQKQPPGYQRLAAWWVVSAKRPETRQKRLQHLIEYSRTGRRI
jgi:uncharacterized protein YdeI (YjbR/CyaY-like superfamily)